MNARLLLLASLGAVALAGCADRSYVSDYDAPPPPPPPPPHAMDLGRPIGPGAIAGTVAADRNGDGVVDGYYTPDGAFHPLDRGYCPPPPPRPSRRGERG